MNHEIERAWTDHRRRVFDLSYRMLGTVFEAEDVVQETFLRLSRSDVSGIDDVEGWLVTVSARVCLDRLRSHDRSRAMYVGPWLPEPLLSTEPTVVEDRITLDDTVRLALLVVLERMTPAERTSFVLHDVFGMTFEEVGAIVGRSPEACRQLASRARRRIAADRLQQGTLPDRKTLDDLVRRFVAACDSGDFDALIGVLDPDAIGEFDSGGAIPGAPAEAIHGAHLILRQLRLAFEHTPAVFRPGQINGEPGVLVWVGGTVVAALALAVLDGHVHHVHAIGNPAKLRHVAPSI